LDPLSISSDVSIPTLGFQIDKDKPDWYNYFLCGVKGICDKFGFDRFDLKPVGMNVCVYGTIPKSSGLSSSSALVVCAALVTLCANKLSLSKQRLAGVCAYSEQYIGTQGGGMDQAICILAKAGTVEYFFQRKVFFR
jgi:N-acetylgalactosamine kinase